MAKMIGILGGMGAFAGLSMCQHLMRIAANNGAVHDSDFPKLLYYNLPCLGMDETGVVDSVKVFSQLRGIIGRMDSFGCHVIVPACNSILKFHAKLQTHYSGTLLNLVECCCLKVNIPGPVGVICSQSSRADRLYEDFLVRLNHVCITTTDDEQKVVNSIIKSAMRGEDDTQNCTQLNNVMENLKHRGACSIILGCTELGLVSKPDTDLPVFDSAKTAMEDAFYFRG